MGGVISLYKATTILQPKMLGFVWCTLSHCLFPKAMDNQPEKYSMRSCIRGGTTRFKCHVINSRIMRANKAKECNYGGWAGFCST